MMGIGYEVRRGLCENVMLAFVMYMHLGVYGRMEKELKALVLDATTIAIAGASEKKYSVWTVGSVMSALRGVFMMWLSNKGLSSAAFFSLHFPSGS